MSSSRTIPSVNTPIPSHCPVTGLPVYGHSSWTYSSSAGTFRLQVYFIGERIVWLQPRGHVQLRHAQKSLALVSDVLFAMLPEKDMPYIAIDDYSAVTGVTLNARRYVLQTLLHQTRLDAYIVYGASKIFRRGLSLNDLVGVFPFNFIVARDYAEAVSIAHQRYNRTGQEEAMDTGSSNGLKKTKQSPDLGDDDRRDKTISQHASELMVQLGRINLETYGINSDYRQVSPDHPFRAVYDALAVLRDDMQAILQRHREALENLKLDEKEITDKQDLLNETYTTLNILLDTRREERRRFELLIKDRFTALLQPLVDGLGSTNLTSRQSHLIRVLREVINRIGLPLPCESERLRAPFTARERFLAHLLASGQNTREIAFTLGLSRRTVENHCQRMREKAGLKGRRPTLKSWLISEYENRHGKRE